MGSILDGVEGKGQAVAVRCPICGQENRPHFYCRHVRWTFDQGGPIDFARYAVSTSPYVYGRQGDPREIPNIWWDANGEWVVDTIDLRFHVGDGYVFGELGTLDLVARDVWKRFRPDVERAPMTAAD